METMEKGAYPTLPYPLNGGRARERMHGSAIFFGVVQFFDDFSHISFHLSHIPYPFPSFPT